MILVVDQTPGPLLCDIVNAIDKSNQFVTLFCGGVKSGQDKLRPSIKIVQAKAYRRNTIALRLSTWLTFSLQYFFYLLFCRRPTAILAITNPPFSTFVTSFVASKRRIPFCLLIYDLYPEALFHAGMGKSDSLVTRLWKRLNRRYFGRASRIFTISQTMKTEIAKYVSSDKIEVIHNWADTDHIKPIAKQANPFLHKLGLQDKKIVLYAGNCGLTHDLESLVEAAHLLREHGDIFFLMVGEGAKKEKLQRMAASLSLSNILFLPYQSDADFPSVVAAADIAIITLGVALEAISVPSKTYSSLAAGACLVAVAHENSELAEIIRSYDLGALCPPAQPGKLAAIIASVCADRERLAGYKENALRAVADFTRANAEGYADYLKNFH